MMIENRKIMIYFIRSGLILVSFVKLDGNYEKIEKFVNCLFYKYVC